MAKFKKLAIISSAVLMTTAFAFGVAACEDETPAAHVHSYSESWVTDATHHWYGCTGTDCSSTVGKTEHVWNDGEETANGENTVKCVVCGYEKKETVATKLAVGEDTTVKVVAGTATEVAVDATAGSYTISWTNPKTIVKVGETEYKKADNEDAEGYVGTADLLWIEDGVKVTVGTTDGSAADIVISCAKYSAPQLMSYDHSAMMSMMMGEEMPETETVANGERGTQFTIYAQNPGWYYVYAEAEDGEDDVNTPNVRENDYSATISVSASNAYTTPATVTEGMVAIEVPANSVIDVVVTHDASTAIDVSAYAVYMIEIDPEAIANEDYMNAYKNSLAEVEISINPMWQPTQMQELFVPMARRVYGRLLNVVNPVQVSWNDPNLVFDIAGTVYTQEDCPVKVERDTFNPTGVYFTAYTKDGQFTMDVIEFSQAPVSEITLGDQSVVVDPNSYNEIKFVATASGAYTFTVDYDVAMELGLEQISVGSQTAFNYPDNWLSEDAIENEDVSITLNVAKGAEIGLGILHTQDAPQSVPFNVSFESYEVSNTPLTSGAEYTFASKKGIVINLPAGVYTFQEFTVEDTVDPTQFAFANSIIDGMPVQTQPIYVFEDTILTIYGMSTGTGNVKVTVNYTVAELPTKANLASTTTTVSIGAGETVTYYFEADELNSYYTIAVATANVTLTDANDMWSATSTENGVCYARANAQIFTITNNGTEATTVTFTITKGL